VSERAAPFSGVIFDMDGVLTDSEPAFQAAVNDVLARYGEHISAEEYQPLIGSATQVTWAAVVAMKKLPLSIDEAIAAFEPPLMARLREPRPALPHARATVERLREAGVPVALCTASYRRWVDAILASAGLEGLFDAVSCADMVERTKPDAEPYLLAARMLGLPQDRCVAVEDSVNGLTSALRAGMYVVQLRATAMAAEPMAGVGRVIASLADFPFGLLSTESARAG
jgi:HAD superfamily hydrolase (TIGR01509 family)